MEQVASIAFSSNTCAAAIEVATLSDLPDALQRLGFQPPRRTLVNVGGAGKMSKEDMERVRLLFDRVVGPLAALYGIVVVDGGTAAGVMRVAGEVRAAAGFDLIGVAAVGTVKIPGRDQQPPQGADLDAHHSHFVLVPGTAWGAESGWISDVASTLSVDQPSATLLSNGGDIAWDDVDVSVRARRPVIVVAGTGRTADMLAGAVRGDRTNARAESLVASGLIQVVDPAHDLRQTIQVLTTMLRLPAEEALARLDV